MDALGSPARKKGVLLVFMAVAIVIAVVSALPSCDGPPSKTCYGDRVNALGATEDSGPNRACTTCLQARNAPKSCCDAVGACDEDPEKQCVPSFQATHLCVLDGGPSAESRCKGLLTNDRSKTLYSCMRSNCAEECGGIPSCDLNSDVGLFINPVCDNCMGGACCEKINACYRDRRCKLVVECIAKHCPRTLGPAMTALGLAPQETRRAASEAVCAGRKFPESDSAGACIQRCLDDFAPDGDGGTTDDQTARCLAFRVYSCGAEAKCGPSCMRPDAGPYSGEGEWSEDNPDISLPDAGMSDAGP
jgi:hypothetical protein